MQQAKKALRVSGALRGRYTAPGETAWFGSAPLAAPALPFPLDGHCLVPVLLSMKFPSIVNDNECYLAHLKILLPGVVLLYDLSKM